MAEELFRAEKTEAALDIVIATSVTHLDDGSVRITQVSQRTTPENVILTELETNIDFTQAEWAQIVEADFIPPKKRVISVDDFVGRITMAEMTAFETMMVSSATARAWWSKLMSRQTKGVDLDGADIVAGFAFVKQAGIPGIWPDGATADARIAEIRA